MDLDGRTDSSSISTRSLHWAPLRSWNLFSGRVPSRFHEEPSPADLPRSRSWRNCAGEGSSRTGPTTTETRVARPRANESTRKGGDCSRRDHNYRAREDSEVNGRRRMLQEKALEASDASTPARANRPGATIAHHQQQNHDQHHHHHFHYHHVYHRAPRHQNEQDQSARRPGITSVNTGRLARRNGDQRAALGNQTPSVMMTNSHVAISTRNAAIEARDRLAERLRGAALLSHRPSTDASLSGDFLEEFSLLFDDGDDRWSDDELWELGIQDWLGVWGYGEVLPSAALFSVPKGLSKSTIGNLHKEVFVPKTRRKDKEVGDASLEQDDCSVCLEHFLAGQLLINLPCKHRFHLDCLTPWLESHSQCPYCRSKIAGEGRSEASSSDVGTVRVLSSIDELVAWMGLTTN